MTLNKEEQIVILFALHSLGGKAKKHRVIHYITQNDLLLQKPDDNKLVSSNESKVENDLAWARESLKEKKLLDMPEHGVWRITDEGRQQLYKLAGKAAKLSVESKENLKAEAERLNSKFIEKLILLGQSIDQTDFANSK
jgi:restriction endonuclease Mrr